MVKRKYIQFSSHYCDDFFYFLSSSSFLLSFAFSLKLKKVLHNIFITNARFLYNSIRTLFIRTYTVSDFAKKEEAERTFSGKKKKISKNMDVRLA